jgi:hypothetical protein
MWWRRSRKPTLGAAGQAIAQAERGKAQAAEERESAAAKLAAERRFFARTSGADVDRIAAAIERSLREGAS